MVTSRTILLIVLRSAHAYEAGAVSEAVETRAHVHADSHVHQEKHSPSLLEKSKLAGSTDGGKLQRLVIPEKTILAVSNDGLISHEENFPLTSEKARIAVVGHDGSISTLAPNGDEQGNGTTMASIKKVLMQRVNPSSHNRSKTYYMADDANKNKNATVHHKQDRILERVLMQRVKPSSHDHSEAPHIALTYDDKNTSTVHYRDWTVHHKDYVYSKLVRESKSQHQSTTRLSDFMMILLMGSPVTLLIVGVMMLACCRGQNPNDSNQLDYDADGSVAL